MSAWTATVFPGILLSSGPDCIQAELARADAKDIGKDEHKLYFKNQTKKQKFQKKKNKETNPPIRKSDRHLKIKDSKMFQKKKGNWSS